MKQEKTRMVLWKDFVADTLPPYRFQIPKVYSEYDISDFGTVSVQFQDQEFIEWFKNLEKTLCSHYPTYDSRFASSDTLHIKCQPGFTQYYDSNYNLMFDYGDSPPSLRNKDLDCIIEVSPYGPFNGKYGVSIKMYQMRLVSHDCLL